MAKREPTPEEIEAKTIRDLAEAEKFKAEARAAAAEAAKLELDLIDNERMSRLTEIRVSKAEEEEEARLASDDHHRVYRFLGQVAGTSVEKAVSRLVQWHRVEPGCQITFIIDSPGGGIIEGFHLYDTLLWLRSEGHHLTTLAQGMAASMAGILLQAGDERVMGPQASMLIHEASFGAMGSMGQIEDTVEFAKKLQERLVGILAERSSLSKTQIKNKWKRKNWWLDASEALKYGFVDRIA